MKKYYCFIAILIIWLICGCATKEKSTSEESKSVPQSENVTQESSVLVKNIVLTPDTDKITTNGGDTGTTKITIEVTDDNGTGLLKTVSLTSTLGTLKDANGTEITKITTDSYGRAEFYFESGENPGNATITAEADGVIAETKIEIVKIGAISLTADKQYLLRKESTLLHIKVDDIYGNPATGIKVKMNSENSSIVSVGLDTLTTDENGEASIYVTAGSPENNTSVTLIAQSGDKTSEITLTVVVPNNIILSVTPTTINTGGETATINAWVTDKKGQGIPQIQVSFSTTLGEISPSVATTNNNGVATTYLTSGDIEGNATITAKAGDLESQAQINIIKSDVVNVPSIIEISDIETTKIYVQGSGNKETSRVTFRVLDGKGNPVKDTRIQFSLVGGSLGGEYLVPTSGVTDEDGEVSTTLKAGTKPGTVKIKAWYNDEVYTETQSITICSGPPEGKHLSIAEQIFNIAGLKWDGIEDEISARLADLYSNPVPEGTAVHFESEYAKIEGADTSTGSGNDTEPGVASANLFSQDPKPVNGAPVHVWVQTQSGAYAFISSLFVDGDTIYAGTDGGGVFKSVDSGENWENVGRPRSYSEGLKGLWGTYINDMSIKDNFIVVATDEGVFYSEDGGYNWRDLQSKSDRITEYKEYNNYNDSIILTYYPINLRERIDVKKEGLSYIGWNISRGKEFSANGLGSYSITYDIDYGTPTSSAKLVEISDDNVFFAYFEGNGIWKFDKTKLHWIDYNRNLPINDISTLTLLDTNLYVTVQGKIYKTSINGFEDLVDLSIGKASTYYEVTENDITETTTHIISSTEDGTNSTTIQLDSEADIDRVPTIIYNGESFNGSWYFEGDSELVLTLSEGNFTAGETIEITYYTKTVELDIPLYPYADTSNQTIDIYVNGSHIYSGYTFSYDIFGTSITLKFNENNFNPGDIVYIYYPQKIYTVYMRTNYPIKNIVGVYLNGTSFNSDVSIIDSYNVKLFYEDGFKTNDEIQINYTADAANFKEVASTNVSFNDAFVSDTDIYYATTEGIKKFDTITNSLSDISFTDCPVSNIKHIVVADDGMIYAGTDLGLYRIENNKAYPLNVYKERIQCDNDTRELHLSYPSDQDKTHTTIYVNGVEMPSTYYEFDNETTIRIREEVDPIPGGAIVEIYYTLDHYNDNYVSAPQKKITALYYYNDKLYFGTENRKVYVVENPSIASKEELPKIRDISGLTNKITSVLYKTGEVMFSGHTRLQALWDYDGDEIFDNYSSENASIYIPNGGSIRILVLVSDENGRPLVSGSKIEFSCDVGKLIANDNPNLADSLYGGEGITEYWITISDDDPTDTDPAKSGSLKIEVTSENDGETLSIPITVD